MGRQATDRAVAKFLAYFEEIKRLHRETLGRPIEMYKSTDSACLAQQFHALYLGETRGDEFVAEMVHRLTWGQCLGNANHRTTVLFVRNFLEWAGVQFPHDAAGQDAESRFEASLNEWTRRSQALVRRRGEAGYAQARLEPRHREITAEWVKGMLGRQSDVLTMIGPQRLMDFIS